MIKELKTLFVIILQIASVLFAILMFPIVFGIILNLLNLW
jgi:hypothetical protein